MIKWTLEPNLQKPHLKKSHAKNALIIIQTDDFKYTLVAKIHITTNANMHTITDIPNLKEISIIMISKHTSTLILILKSKQTIITDKHTNVTGKPPTCMLNS